MNSKVDPCFREGNKDVETDRWERSGEGANRNR